LKGADLRFDDDDEDDDEALLPLLYLLFLLPIDDDEEGVQVISRGIVEDRDMCLSSSFFCAFAANSASVLFFSFHDLELEPLITASSYKTVRK